MMGVFDEWEGDREYDDELMRAMKDADDCRDELQKREAEIEDLEQVKAALRDCVEEQRAVIETQVRRDSEMVAFFSVLSSTLGDLFNGRLEGSPEIEVIADEIKHSTERGPCKAALRKLVDRLTPLRPGPLLDRRD